MNLKELSNDELIAEHKRYTARMAQADNIQKAKKVILNAAYGALSNEHFRFFDDRLAEAITLSGQLSVQWVAKRLNEYLNELLQTNDIDYVIAIDTDSVYLNLQDLMDKIAADKDIEARVNLLDKICDKRIQPIIDEAYNDLAAKMNALAQRMFMKREAIADKAIWLAKKRYILNIYRDETVAYTEPEIKITGMEAVRTTTPAICREKIKECLKVIMNKGERETQEFLTKFKAEFFALPFEDVACPSGVNGLEDYADDKTVYRKGTPMHVRAALVFNHALRERGLDHKYNPIRSGDKIKYAILIEPNPFHENVIAVGDALPPELDLASFIDYQAQWDKTFMGPIQSILDIIGWKANKRATLF